MKLTETQIDNWRKVMGPMAMMLDDAGIQTLRDKYHERINEPTSHMQALMDNGCELSKYFPGLYHATGGNPCKECAIRNECKIQSTVNIKAKTQESGGETNAQIAARLGITKRQVAKRRKEGTLV